MNIYEVGGHVRDSILNKSSSDIDYVIEASSYAEMKEYITSKSRKIFLEKPLFGTIRYLNLDGVPEDISLCVKSRNIDGSVKEVGSIEDDLLNRDFTINSIARNIIEQNLVDPLSGKTDIYNKVLRCSQAPDVVFRNDPARIIRAMRFKIELGFEYDSVLKCYLKQEEVCTLLKSLNRERLRQELDKCFKSSPQAMICELQSMGSDFMEVLFQHHKITLNIR